MANVDEKAQITSVFYNEGVYDNVNGTTLRKVKAPFDLVLMLNSDTGTFDNYVQPCSILTSDWVVNISDNRSTERWGMGSIVDEITVPESNCGDHAGNAENWRGFFRLGMV